MRLATCPHRYGTASYEGGLDTVTITLSGLTVLQRLFNIDIVFQSQGADATLNWVWSRRGGTELNFTQDAYVNQTFTTSQFLANDAAYYLNATSLVSNFTNVLQAYVDVRISNTTSNTIVWPINITSAYGTPTQVLYALPHHLLQYGRHMEYFHRLISKYPNVPTI